MIWNIWRLLWQRHKWEAFIFVAISWGLTWTAWTDSDSGLLDILVWMEGASVAWLITRVTLSRGGIGTFGGWKARPVKRRWYQLAEMIYLAGPLLLAVIARGLCAVAVLSPSGEGWVRLLHDWFSVAWWLMIFYGVILFAARAWEREDRKSSSRFAWGLALVVAVFCGGMAQTMNPSRSSGRSGGSEDNLLDPRNMPGVEDWQWLVHKYSFKRVWDATEVDIVKIPLVEGARFSGEDLSLRISRVMIEGNQLEIEVETVRPGSEESFEKVELSLMVKYGNGYFGQRWYTKREGYFVGIPMMKAGWTKSSGLFLSPMILPENELSWDEVMKGAELWCCSKFVKDGSKMTGRSLGGEANGTKRFLDLEKDRNMIAQGGRILMDDVLGSAPWSDEVWWKVVFPYLMHNAIENDRDRLLKIAMRNPLMSELMLEKGWSNEVLPVLRRQLHEGKALGERSLIALASLREEEMGPRLENQLLRMSGDLDRVVEVVKNHPGVDWDRVRKEAWSRQKFGFGSHHVWAKWGAELGEKEALRSIVAKASSGKKWERWVLENWFGKRESLIDELRTRWDEVAFVDGKWRLPANE